MRFICFLLVLLFTTKVFAAFESLRTDISDQLIEQHIINQNFWGVSYANRFNLPELGIFTFDLFIDSRWLPNYYKLSYTGDEIYNEYSLLIAHQYKLKKFTLHISPSLYNGVIKGYRSYSTAEFSLAMAGYLNTNSYLLVGRENVLLYENRPIHATSNENDFITLGLDSRSGLFLLSLNFEEFNLKKLQLNSHHELSNNFSIYFKAVDNPQEFTIGFIFYANALTAQSRLFWIPPIGLQQQGKTHIKW